MMLQMFGGKGSLNRQLTENIPNWEDYPQLDNLPNWGNQIPTWVLYSQLGIWDNLPNWGYQIPCLFLYTQLGIWDL